MPRPAGDHPDTPLRLGHGLQQGNMASCKVIWPPDDLIMNDMHGMELDKRHI